jgi:glycosyltransferase involved in cell wall biosynthesis
MSSSVLPLVSVVMPSFNHAQFIAESIASVLGQSYPRIELIVADGGSDDGTLAILRDCQARDSRLRWFSGPDAGPADAVNKAMGQVRGTVIGWLNSDDLYTAGAVERAVSVLALQRDCAAVYGNGQHIGEEGNTLGDYPTMPPSVSLNTFLDGCFICQPTMFLARSAYMLLGPLDTGLRTAFDFEYWLRLFTHMPGRVGFVEAVQAQSRLHPNGITQRMRREVALEGLKVLRRHLGRAPVHWVLTHVDEILAGIPSAQASPQQRAEIAGFLRQAAEYLAPGYFENLMAQWG